MSTDNDENPNTIILILELIFILAILGLLAFGMYIEYKEIHDITSATKEHNGTCKMNGVYISCGYQESYYTSTYSERCYRNNELINCSEIGGH